MPVFGEQPKKKSAGVPVVNEIVGRVNDNTKRLRLIEERQKLLTSRISSMDESITAKLENLETARKDIDARLSALDQKVETVNNTLKEVVKQMQYLAKKSELKKVEETVKIFESVLPQLGSQNGTQSGSG